MINLFDKNKKVKIASSIDVDRNGNSYSMEALRSMQKTINEEDIFGQIGSINDSGGIDVTKATHKCYGATIEDGVLYCKIKFLDTPYVEKTLGYLKENSFELFSFKAEGEEQVDPTTDKIYDHKLNSVNLFIEKEG